MTMDPHTSIPVPQPVAFFGFRTGIKGNVQFINEHEILYPAGSVLVIHHLIQNSHKFLKPVDQQKGIKEIVLSPNRKIAAITSQGDNKMTMYDVVSMKRKKVLVLPELSDAIEFISYTFTHDNKGILAVTGEPDWTLYYFNWEKGKLESSCKATVPGNPGKVTQVVAHPSDATTCILVGPGLFRMMAVAETVWRQFGWQKADQLNICCAVHLSAERILAGTTDGRFILVENNDLKGIIKATDLNDFDPKGLEAQQSSSTISVPDTGLASASSGGDREIRCLVSFLRGFAFAQGSGTIFLFEADNNMVYRRKRTFTVPTLDIKNMFNHDLTTIRWITISPSMERMVVATDRTQLYTSPLWTADNNQEEKISLQILGEALHHGPIAGLAMCQWKPLFMTVGKVDRTVRLWNYETESQELAKQYLEDIYCIALHPTGFYVALGFCDKLRYMTVSIDDLVESRDFPIRSCTVCCFSTNGHLFAAANRNVIQIYSTLSYQNMYNLRGHFGKITKIAWTPYDLKLVSCGLEGAVYEWDISTSGRVNEVITKTCGYTDVAVSADAKITYAVGTDGLLKEINDSQMEQEIEKLENARDQVQLHLEEYRQKYNACEAELQAERTKHQNTNKALRRIWIDFHSTSRLIQHPKELREALKVLYQKYGGNPSLLLSKVQDTEAQSEFSRQREHLERTVASLKRQLLKGSMSHHGEHDKMMEDNIALIKELNIVRAQLKKCHYAQNILDQIMAAPGAKSGDYKNLQQRLANVLQEHEDLGAHGARRVRDLQKMVEALTEEVQRLSALIGQTEAKPESLQIT